MAEIGAGVDVLGEAVVAEVAGVAVDARVAAVVVEAADEVPAAATVGRATKMVVSQGTNCKRKSRDESCGFFLGPAKLLQEFTTWTRVSRAKFARSLAF